MADGGEGTLAAVADALGDAAERRTVATTDALGRPIEADWLLLDEGRGAFVEMAAASGLARLTPEERTPENARRASTRGTGDLIRAALDAGVERITIGLGGSATTDGGSGLLRALGVRFLGRDGAELPDGGAALADLDRIDPAGLDPRLARGEAHRRLRRHEHRWSGAAARPRPTARRRAPTPRRSRSSTPRWRGSAPASRPPPAGWWPTCPARARPAARPPACSASRSATLRPGVDVVAELVGLAAALEEADLVITGEGRADEQTLQGKTAMGVATLARPRNSPVVLLCGALGPGAEALDVADGADRRAADRRPAGGPLDRHGRHRTAAGGRGREAGAHHRHRPGAGAPVGAHRSMARKGPSPQKRAADRRKRRKLADVVLERLGDRYEHPTWAGPRVDTVSELVLTILSQNTADTNSFRAFTALRARYPDWDAVLAAPTDELEDVIRPGGLAPTKSRRIQHVLAEVHAATNGTWDLGFLGTMPLVEAREWLTALPGIGRKTASIILLFGFGRPAMPVDTHVHRVTTRLGMLPPRTPLPTRPRPAGGGARAGRDVPVPRRDDPARARHLPRPAADLRPLPADRCLRLLRPRREGQGTDGAGARGAQPRTARRATTTS